MIKKLFYTIFYIFIILTLFLGVTHKSSAIPHADKWYFWLDESTNEFGPYDTQEECDRKVVTGPQSVKSPWVNGSYCYLGGHIEITSISPSQGASGDNIVISGNNFIKIKSVNFLAIPAGPVPATVINYTYDLTSPTKKITGISVIVPSSVPVGATTVTVEDMTRGKSDPFSFTKIATPIVITPQQNKTNKYNPDEYKLLAPLTEDFKVVDNKKTVSDYLGVIFKIIIGLCSALAVIMIIIGGIQWMGQDSVFGKVEAKGKIMRAIGGLLLALGAWVLLNTINPDLLGGKGVTIKQVKVSLDPRISNSLFMKTGPKDCSQAPSPCSESDLKSAFGDNAGKMSTICHLESSGLANSQSKTDFCPLGPGGSNSGITPFSFGLFQINILVHGENIYKAGGPKECSELKFTSVDNTPLKSNYLVNNKYDCKLKTDAGMQAKYNTCVSWLKNGTNNIKVAFYLFNTLGQKLNPWNSDYGRCPDIF